MVKAVLYAGVALIGLPPMNQPWHGKVEEIAHRAPVECLRQEEFEIRMEG